MAIYTLDLGERVYIIHSTDNNGMRCYSRKYARKVAAFTGHLVGPTLARVSMKGSLGLVLDWDRNGLLTSPTQ